jgi:hypothetical protein
VNTLDPFAKLRRVRDPELAAEIADAAIRRARELLAEQPIPPEVLAKIAAILGPIKVAEDR